MSDMDMGERAGEDFAAGQATTSIVKGRAVVVNAEDRARAIHAYYGRSQFALHEQRRWIELGTRPEPSSDTPEHGVDVYEEILPRIAFEFAWQRTELESESVEPDAQTRTIAMAAGLTGNATFEQTIARVRMLVDYARALQLIEIAAENVGYKRTLGAESYAGLPDFVMQLGKDLRRHGKPDLHAADVAKADDRDRPAHYGGEANPFEAIKVIEHYGWGENFCLGNALKYLLRAGRKGSEMKVADLRKAAWYATRAAEKAEG